MTALLFALLLAEPRYRAKPTLLEGLEPPQRAWSPPIAWAGRIVTHARFHLGVRAHALITSSECAGVVTIQITTTNLP